jgi:IclR family acetate operon transcriptional repressor
LLHTLEVERFVGRTPEGLFALQGLTRPLLSARARHELELAAAPHLAELAATTRETVGLAILCDNHLEVVAVLDSPQAVRMGNTVGRILPPHASSLGKAVLSRLAQPERDRLVDAYGLARYTRHTIVDRRQLILDLDRAATRGYALDDEENAVGGVCAGVAICAAGGAPVGAVSVSMPKARWDVAETRALTLAAVKRAAAGITAALGAGTRAP